MVHHAVGNSVPRLATHGDKQDLDIAKKEKNAREQRRHTHRLPWGSMRLHALSCTMVATARRDASTQPLLLPASRNCRLSSCSSCRVPDRDALHLHQVHLQRLPLVNAVPYKLTRNDACATAAGAARAAGRRRAQNSTVRNPRKRTRIMRGPMTMAAWPNAGCTISACVRAACSRRHGQNNLKQIMRTHKANLEHVSIPTPAGAFHHGI